MPGADGQASQKVAFAVLVLAAWSAICNFAGDEEEFVANFMSRCRVAANYYGSADPFFVARGSLAGAKESLVDFALLPVVVSRALGKGFLPQSSPLIVNLFTTFTFCCFALSFGIYGQLDEISAGCALVIVGMRMGIGVFVHVLAEVLQSGYGLNQRELRILFGYDLGSGLDLLIATNIGATLLATRLQLEHTALLPSSLINPENWASLDRSYVLLQPVAACVGLVGLHCIYVDRQRKKTVARALFEGFVAHTAIVSTIHSASLLQQQFYGSSFGLVQVLGRWRDLADHTELVPEGGSTTLVPVGGLSYWISAPHWPSPLALGSLSASASGWASGQSHLHALFYLCFTFAVYAQGFRTGEEPTAPAPAPASVPARARAPAPAALAPASSSSSPSPSSPVPGPSTATGGAKKATATARARSKTPTRRGRSGRAKKQQ